MLVDSPDALATLMETLSAEPSFAYDTEFIGENSYKPLICVIQVATAGGVWVIDAMVDLDLAPFWNLLAEPGKRKIVHAGEQDLEPVWRFSGKPPANVLDTQIAAGLCGMSYPASLRNVVKETLGVELVKGFTFTDWSHRPLSKKQIRYAADDVRYLPAAAVEIEKRINARGHTAWALAECDERCDAANFTAGTEADFVRIKGLSGLSGKELAIVRSLVDWRDEAARTDDLPVRTFLRDDALLALARKPNTPRDKIGEIKNFPRPTAAKWGDAVVDTIARARSSKPLPVPPKPPELNATERFRVDATWALTQLMCAVRGIDAALITSRNDIAELLHARDVGESIEQMRPMTGWRRDAMGNQLLELLDGKQTLHVHVEQGQMRSR